MSTVFDILLKEQRNKTAAKRFFNHLVRLFAVFEKIITDQRQLSGS